jgi:beta-alanine degradation protein BauB
MTKTKRAAAIGTVKCEDAEVRVTEWRFAPGAATGWHRHEHDYVVVPLLSGKLGLEEPSGTREALLTRGVPYHRQEGVEHDVININAFEFAFLEVELKRK